MRLLPNIAKVYLGEVKRIEHRDDIRDVLGQRIGGTVMRFIARTVTPRIYENETVTGSKGVDVPDPIPALHAPKKPVLKHQGWACTLDPVMDTDALIDCVKHRHCFPGKPTFSTTCFGVYPPIRGESYYRSNTKGNASLPQPSDGQGSKGLVYSDGTWAVATGGLEPGLKHEVCLDAMKAPDTTLSTGGLNVNDFLPLRLGEGHAKDNGNFLKSGNLIDKYENFYIAGDWAGLTILIYAETGPNVSCTCLNPNPGWPPPVCVDHVQESGLYIAK